RAHRRHRRHRAGRHPRRWRAAAAAVRRRHQTAGFGPPCIFFRIPPMKRLLLSLAPCAAALLGACAGNPPSLPDAELAARIRAETVREALESIRDVYGYDFRMEGRRITVYPPTLQTRIFSVNYPTTQRRGRSELHVSSSSAPNNSSSNGSTPGAPGSSSAAPE